MLIRRGTIAKTSSRQRSSATPAAPAFLAGHIKALDRTAPDKSRTFNTAPQSAAFAAVCSTRWHVRHRPCRHLARNAISALGLDSLQRVELVAALDGSFGRHLPDSVYSRATTLGDLAAAVQKHQIDHPHNDAPEGEIPAENYDVSLFPEYLEFKRHERMLLAVAEVNPYFRVDQGAGMHAVGMGGVAHIDGRRWRISRLRLCRHGARRCHAATKAVIDLTENRRGKPHRLGRKQIIETSK